MDPIRFEILPDTTEQTPVRILYRETGAGSRGCEFHWHSQLEFYFVCRGGVRLNCGGKQHWVRGGQAAFVSGYVPHKSLEFLDGTCHYIVQIDPAFLLREQMDGGEVLERLRRDGGGYGVLYTQGELSNPLERLVEENRQRLTGYRLVVRAAAVELLARLVRVQDRPEVPGENGSRDFRLVCELLDLLHADCCYSWTLTELASRLGVSTAHLCRVFRRQTGETVMGYLNQVRCTRALSYLSGGTGVAQTAQLLGFEDYNYFSRLFKKTMGASPRKFMKKDGPHR